MNDIAGLDTQSPQLDRDPARFQEALKRSTASSRENRHASESFDADPGHHEMMARQAIRVPCPFVDIFERIAVDPAVFRSRLLLLDLTQDSSDRLKELGTLRR